MPINLSVASIEKGGNWADNSMFDVRFSMFVLTQSQKMNIEKRKTNIELLHFNPNSPHQHTGIKAMANPRSKFIIKD